MGIKPRSVAPCPGPHLFRGSRHLGPIGWSKGLANGIAFEYNRPAIAKHGSLTGQTWLVGGGVGNAAKMSAIILITSLNSSRA